MTDSENNMTYSFDALKSFKEFLKETYNRDFEFVDAHANINNHDIQVKITPDHIWEEFVSKFGMQKFAEKDGTMVSYEIGFKVDGSYDLKNNNHDDALAILSGVINEFIKRIIRLDPQTFYFTIHEPRRRSFYEAALRNPKIKHALSSYERNAQFEQMITERAKELFDVNIGTIAFTKRLLS